MSRRAGDPTSIHGVRPVTEALRAGRRRVHEVSLPDDPSTPGLRELRELVGQCGVALRPASPGQGVEAQADPFPEESIESLLTAGTPRFWVGLDRVTDVGNLGAIARTAEAAGVTGLVLEHRRAPPIGPGALRASAGALEYLRVGRTPNLAKALPLMAGEGISILAADSAGPSFESIKPDLLLGDLIWIFGSEDRGIRREILARADQVVGIPLLGRIASLGVASAAAHLLLRTAELRSRPD